MEEEKERKEETEQTASQNDPTEEEVDFEGFLYDSKVFIEKKLAYYQLDLLDKVTREVSTIITLGIVGVLSLGCFIFVCFCLGFILSEIFESMAIGFGIVTVFFILLTLMVFIFRVSLIQKPIANLFIKQLFKEEEKNG